MFDIKDLKNEELKKVSGGLENSNASNYGIVFEKGKWVQLPQDSSYVYKLVELTDKDIIVDVWNRRRLVDKCIPTPQWIVECTRNHKLPVIMLYNLIETNKPDWVNE